MPFNDKGERPDIIINPHAIPSRMTIGHLNETVIGKVLAELGLFGDGTAFNEFNTIQIKKDLIRCGYESGGNELFYNGETGEQIECAIFCGPIYYQRLKHMVRDKQHVRSTGPTVNLTRQPQEGKSKDGGLRLGEMERDCLVSHGASDMLYDRIMRASDKFTVAICNGCGKIPVYNDKRKIHLCRICNNRTDFSICDMPYSLKLEDQELMGMGVGMRFVTEEVFTNENKMNI